MDPDFYRALEDRFRGSRDLIKSRLQVYLPFIEPLKEAYPDLHAIDLGCGRGEWLEILGGRGFQAQGVDLNDGMLSACRDLDLKVQTGDALSFLKKLPDDSQVIVSAFHLIEHIPFEDLQEIVKESLRVLKPAGLLVLETPNPENIIVGTSSFYMDPTHTSPIPPDLLAFLPEYYGYHNTKVLRLQETPEIRELENLSFLDVLNGTSPDYAIVAQKCGTKSQLDLTNHAFQTEYGTTQAQLAMAYDKDIKTLLQQTAEDANQAAEDVKQIQDELQAIYNSHSWRITAPAREIIGKLKQFKYVVGIKIDRTLKNKIGPIAIGKISIFVDSNPNFRKACITLIKKLGLYSSIKSLYYNIYTKTYYLNSGKNASSSDTTLSPHAQRIYKELNDAIAKHQKEKL